MKFYEVSNLGENEDGEYFRTKREAIAEAKAALKWAREHQNPKTEADSYRVDEITVGTTRNDILGMLNGRHFIAARITVWPQ